MTYQSSLEETIGYVKAHELEINGLGTEPDVGDLNELIIGRGRQVLALTSEVFELEENSEGKLSQSRSYCYDNITVFGKLAGVTCSNEQTLDTSGNEIVNRSIVGFLLKKYFSDKTFFYVPVGSIESIHDVNEATEKIKGLDDVIEELSIEETDLFALAKYSTRIPGDALSVAITKAYIQSVALPTELCKSVVAKKYTRIGDNLRIVEPITQYLDDEYRLSMVINSDGNIPTLCFEQESDDGKTSNHIILDPESFTGYQKP